MTKFIICRSYGIIKPLILCTSQPVYIYGPFYSFLTFFYTLAGHFPIHFHSMDEFLDMNDDVRMNPVAFRVQSSKEQRISLLSYCHTETKYISCSISF